MTECKTATPNDQEQKEDEKRIQTEVMLENAAVCGVQGEYI